MNTWFCLPLGDGLTAPGTSDEILAAFRPAFAAAGNPADMAIFTRYDSEGRLHCEVTAFFSPAAASVAQILGARPCAKPAREGLGLLAGE
ncbi:MAG: hypothetical protein ACM3QS_04045, partial [Bacteroidota bacterium]